ncbi:MAG: recombinase family protein, partial [Microcystaceae cyanobacterium]
QRPLYSEALIRSLLTLLALIFPGLGGFALRDDVAEMLVILSQIPRLDEQSNQKLVPIIDPVRAGILADICYQLNPDNPQLLPIETFARWDRLGYPATQKYQAICQWITIAKNDLLKVSNLTPLDILHRAIAELLPDQQYLNYAQLAAIRELIETAQHFWEVEEKLGEKSSEFRDKNLGFALNQTTPNPENLSPNSIRLSHFLQLLKLGTISANPLPLAAWGQNSQRVILATIFQYRSLRSQHRWHFWLDAGSSLWSQGGASQLFAAPLFQQHWSGEMWDTEAQLQLDQARMERIIRDLLGRVEEKLFLCHSDLNVRGVEQIGPLLNLIQAAS